MAYGIELLLGYAPNQQGIFSAALQRALGVSMGVVRDAPTDVDPRAVLSCDDEDAREAYQATREVFAKISKRFERRLMAAHRRALQDMGFKRLPPPSRTTPQRHVHAQTPAGPREFVPWFFDLCYDRDEMGESAADAVLGVAISGRYYPTFADWRNEHGTLSPMIFNAELRRAMKIAKRRLVEALPWLDKAIWIVKEMHY